MSTNQLFIPSKIKVGFQNRRDTYTQRLAYIIYYDHANILRKEKSWQSWRDSKIEPLDFTNEPTEGFVLNKGVGGVRQSYGWNARKKEYTPFYDLPWPQEKITQDTLEAFIKDRLGGLVVIRLRPYSMVIRYHDWLYFFPRLTRMVSRRVHKRLSHLLQHLKLDLDFCVQDSGIGNVLFPKESGKGHAMERWAKRLKIPLKDILVIGDQAHPGGNDEDFLSGRYGTAFTVGRQTKNLYPLPVLDHRGHPMKGPTGTAALLGRVF